IGSGKAGKRNGNYDKVEFNAPEGIAIAMNGDPIVADTCNKSLRTWDTVNHDCSAFILEKEPIYACYANGMLLAGNTQDLWHVDLRSSNSSVSSFSLC